MSEEPGHSELALNPQHILGQIRACFRQGKYDFSQHAGEEMAEDGLDLYDVESAVGNGSITKIGSDDPRGVCFTLVGTACDRQTPVGVVGRFRETGIFLIITVYEVTEMQR